MIISILKRRWGEINPQLLEQNIYKRLHWTHFTHCSLKWQFEQNKFKTKQTSVNVLNIPLTRPLNQHDVMTLWNKGTTWNSESFSPAGSRRSAGLLCSEWSSHCRWLLLKNRTLEDEHTQSTVRKQTRFHREEKPSHTHTQWQWVSPRCVICSGIWTGICSAATELGAGLPPLSSSRVSRICSEEEEGLPGPDEVCEDAISSWRPFRRTDHTHRVTFMHKAASRK